MATAIAKQVRSIPAQKRKLAPGPKGCFVFGSFAEMRENQIKLFMDSARDHGDIVRLHLVIYVHLISHPDHVRHVLVDNHGNYEKDRFYDRIKPVVGEGLLTSNGEFWRRQRRLAQPAFHKQRLAGFAATMARSAAERLDEWQARAVDAGPMDVGAEMMKLALQIVGRTLFNAELGGQADTVGEALGTALEVTRERFQSLFMGANLPTPRNRRFNRAMKMLDEVVYGVIEQRRKSDRDEGDLLSMLMSARDEDTGEGMDDLQLRDELMTMLLAGHETSANALTWAWYLLSKHPAVERRLHEEVREVLGDRAPSFEDLPKLKYTRMVIDEVLRLYPPAWLYTRGTIEADEIGGYHIPGKSVVMISPYVLHRNPSVWENPEGFDPERFTEERVAARSRHAYVPFAGGPRQCIGNNFALMELTIILAMVTQRFRLDLVPGQKIEPEPTVTLRPSAPVMMTLRSRAVG